MTEKKMEEWTAADFREEAARMTKATAGSDELLVAAMLLVALRVGPDLKKIAAFLHEPAERLAYFFDRLQENGVFTKDGRIAANWFDEKMGGAEFIIDVAVGLGFLERVGPGSRRRKRR